MRKLKEWAADAATWVNEHNNTSGIPITPALIMSQIQVETHGNPIESAGDGGKGLLQFTDTGQGSAFFRNTLGIDMAQPKPSAETAWSDETNKVGTPLSNNLVFSVWSPRGSIFAFAKFLQYKLTERQPVEISTNSGVIDAKYAILKSEIDVARFYSTLHNRGGRFLNSVNLYARKNGKLPSEFGSVWEVHEPGDRGGGPTYLFGHCIGRCHVEKIAGVCGTTPQGLYQQYSTYFRKTGNTWRAI
ncbi:MAG: hypothetical protein AB7F43_09665 [Bacteriovoracia bacterium]